MSSLIQQEWSSLAPTGVEVRYFEDCGSTNSLATEAGAAGFFGPVWFVAGHQSAGRGRRGREWRSASGNLYCSLLTRLPCRISDLATLPYVVSLAVRDCFASLGCDLADIQCKWPNDVLIHAQKCSGILIESSAGHDQMVDFVVIGIGLNLVSFPEDAAFSATSLKNETGSTTAPSSAFKALSSLLHKRLEDWDPHNVGPVIEEWRQASWGMGQRREIRTVDESFFAVLEDLDEKGGLILSLDDGTKRKLYAGDVFEGPRTH